MAGGRGGLKQIESVRQKLGSNAIYYMCIYIIQCRGGRYIYIYIYRRTECVFFSLFLSLKDECGNVIFFCGQMMYVIVRGIYVEKNKIRFARGGGGGGGSEIEKK